MTRESISVVRFYEIVKSKFQKQHKKRDLMLEKLFAKIEEIEDVKNFLRNVSLISMHGEELIEEVAKYVRLMVLDVGDIVCRAGDVLDKVIYIKSGELKFCSNDEENTYKLGFPGHFFGDYILLSKGKKKHCFCVKATRRSELYVLRKKDFEKAAMKFPNIKVDLHTYLERVKLPRMDDQ